MRASRKIQEESIDDYLDKYGPGKTKNDTIREIERKYKVTRLEAYTKYVAWRNNFMKSRKGI